MYKAGTEHKLDYETIYQLSDKTADKQMMKSNDFFKEKNDELAKKSIQEALETLKKSKYPIKTDRAYVLRKLATFLLREKNYEECEQCLIEAIHIFREEYKKNKQKNICYEIQRALGFMCKLQIILKNGIRLEKYATEFLEKATISNNKEYIIDALRYLFEVNILKNIEKAKKNIEDVKKLREEGTETRHLAKIYFLEKDFRKAKDLAWKAIDQHSKYLSDPKMHNKAKYALSKDFLFLFKCNTKIFGYTNALKRTTKNINDFFEVSGKEYSEDLTDAREHIKKYFEDNRKNNDKICLYLSFMHLSPKIKKGNLEKLITDNIAKGDMDFDERTYVGLLKKVKDNIKYDDNMYEDISTLTFTNNEIKLLSKIDSELLVDACKEKDQEDISKKSNNAVSQPSSQISPRPNAGRSYVFLGPNVGRSERSLRPTFEKK